MNTRTNRLVGLSLLTALIVILQVLARLIPTGIFSLTLSLVPIVVGAALYGVGAGGYLGFVFGVVVLLNNSQLFLEISIPGTIATVLVKGIACGVVAGVTYRLLSARSSMLAAAAAAILCPCVNTGVFLLGCRLFFMDWVLEKTEAMGFSSAGSFLILGLVGVNFLIEIAINLVLSPAIVRIVRACGRRTS